MFFSIVNIVIVLAVVISLLAKEYLTEAEKLALEEEREAQEALKNSKDVQKDVEETKQIIH